MTISTTSTIPLLLSVATVCGVMGRTTFGKVRGGILVSIGFGFLGAFLGPLAARTLHLPQPFMVEVDGRPFSILWTILGAGFLVVIAHLFSRRY